MHVSKVPPRSYRSQGLPLIPAVGEGGWRWWATAPNHMHTRVRLRDGYAMQAGGLPTANAAVLLDANVILAGGIPASVALA